MERNYRKEYQEAVAAGNRALKSLRNAQRELDSARNWGIVDLLGGGMVSAFIKRSRMKEAQSLMDEAKRDMQEFRRELGDICMDENLNVKTGEFLTFADYFFDGILADWLVQDRIQKARDQAAEAVRRVEEILSQLKNV